MNYESRKIDCFTLQKSEFIEFCSRFSREEGSCFFFSGGSYDTAQASYLCLFPFEQVWVEEKVICHESSQAPIPNRFLFENPWEGLKKIISFRESGSEAFPDWVGYFGYEMGAFSDEEKEISYRPSRIPDAYFLRPAIILMLCHISGLLSLHIRRAFDKESKEKLNRIHSIEALLEFLKIFQSKSIKAESGSFFGEDHDFSPIFRKNDSIEKYYEKIEQAKELIRAGEIYQVNLSQAFQIKSVVDPYDVFQKLAAINPAPFMGYFNFPGFTIVSSSPERFLCKKGDYLETRPIKGTMPRGKTDEMDFFNRDALLNSVKDKAELLMITDLMRNDLGRVSCMGTVITEKIWHLESYANVFHLNSVIHSKPKPDMHSIDLIRYCFPAGSITGCPKLRAMEAIYNLEEKSRGIYTGSIGFFSSNGDFDFNVAIRTLLFKEGNIFFSLGGAIVSDSIPEKEYEEILHKGESLFRCFLSDIPSV